MVKRRKVQPSASASSTSGSSSSTTVSSDGAAGSVTSAITSSKTTKGGSGGVSCKVSHTASFASVAKVAEKETCSYGERVSDFLGKLRSHGLFPLPNFDEKLPDLRGRKDEFEEYVTRTRERFATEESNLLRDQSEAECLRVYMSELVRVAGVAEATPNEGKVGETKNSGESEDGEPENSAHESEGESSPETSSGEGEVGETKNSGESEDDKPKNSAHESEGELSAEISSETLDKSDAESVFDMQTCETGSA